jgi:hypothetical protein
MDPVLLQKQVRDHTEEVGKFISDLNNWQKEMKRKEKEMYGSKDEEVSFLHSQFIEANYL